MPSKHYLAAAHPTGGHVTRICIQLHRRVRHVLLGAVVDHQIKRIWQSCSGCSQQCHCSGGCTWHPESHGGQLHELGRYWAKSFMQRMGFVMRKATKTVKKLPPHSEELKESCGIFKGGGEQHSSWFDSQLGSDRRANGARQRLDHDN